MDGLVWFGGRRYGYYEHEHTDHRIGEGVGDRSRRRESVKILDRFGFGLDFLVLLVLESKV